MKRLVLMSVLLLSTLSVLSFGKKKDNNDDFDLLVHIVRVDMAEGQKGIYGDSDTVMGGGSYLYQLYTVHIDGDNRELTMTTPRMHSKGGKGLAIATMGWSAVGTAHHNASLHLGDYKGHWNKDGSLEIQFLDEKGEPKHQPFMIRAESALVPPKAENK